MTDTKTVPFLGISFCQMFSLGSFRIKDMRHVRADTYWYEFTFLFLEITWGRMTKQEE